MLRTLRTQFSDYDVSYSGAVADNDLLNGKCIRRAALPDDFVPHGSCEHLRDLTGLDQNHLHALMREMLDAQRIPERQRDGSRPA